MKDLRILAFTMVLAVVLASCSDPDENFAGSEYMPDMGHSLAVEANTYNYYYYNTWDDQSTVKLSKLVYPRVTVKGAVPRGYSGNYLGDEADFELEEDAESMLGNSVRDVAGIQGASTVPSGISVPTNGHVPYYYEDSPEGRLEAIENLIDNPFPITEEGLAKGNNLYNIFCAICHGMQGNGLGYIYDEDQNPYAAYPLAPANLLTDEFKSASNGRYYHAIYYGYNAMGAYKDKMNYEERWQVIHYIRALQAKDAGKEYAFDSNTFNPTFGVPETEYTQLSDAGAVTDDEEEMTESGQLKK